MKKLFALALSLVLMFSLVGCGGKADSASADNAPMQYMTSQELSDVLGNEDYVILDVRKAADFEEAHIPGAVSADMDAAVNGDTQAGLDTMTKATEGMDENLVLVCYSGKSYAQASTNALKEAGYDMSKVYTLEGGMKSWNQDFADKIEK